jgi:hypothetical protein
MDLEGNTLNRTTERGAVLVEFALVALTLSLLLAATIEFGRLLFYAQALQDVARVAARELSVTPLPLITVQTFDDALRDCDRVQTRIYNPSFLVINLDDFATDSDLDQHFARLPLVNRALRPLMMIDQPDPEGPRFLRYPGALLAESAPACPSPWPTSGYTVGIPRVEERDPDTGAETIRWVPVVEEIRLDPAAPQTGHFGVTMDTCPTAPCGIVALRIN